MLLRPSERARWAHCSGYPAFRALLKASGLIPEDIPTLAAWRGTVGHQISEEVLKKIPLKDIYEWAADPIESLRAVKGYEYLVYTHPNAPALSYTVQPDLIRAVQQYLMAIATIITQYPDPTLRIEWLVRAARNVYGTLDAAVYSFKSNHLTVVDAKFGRTNVPVRQNLQLQTYAVGAVKNTDTDLPIHYVDLVIVQPISGGVKKASYTREDIESWADEINKEAQLCLSRTRHRLVPGSWCKWCICEPDCPAVTLKHEVQGIGNLL